MERLRVKHIITALTMAGLLLLNALPAEVMAQTTELDTAAFADTNPILYPTTPTNNSGHPMMLILARSTEP